MNAHFVCLCVRALVNLLSLHVEERFVSHSILNTWSTTHIVLIIIIQKCNLMEPRCINYVV